MLVVQKQPDGEPAWTPVLGAEVLFAPITRAMLRSARRAALETLGREDGGSDRPAHEQIEELGDALSVALLLAGIRDWRGIAIEEDGGDGPVPLACTDEAKRTVLADAIVLEAFDDAYVLPFITRERERAEPGNGSAASPSGTGEAAMQEPIIAGFPAAKASVGAKRARTGSTPQKRTPKKTSGKS